MKWGWNRAWGKEWGDFEENLKFGVMLVMSCNLGVETLWVFWWDHLFSSHKVDTISYTPLDLLGHKHFRFEKGYDFFFLLLIKGENSYKKKKEGYKNNNWITIWEISLSWITSNPTSYESS